VVIEVFSLKQTKLILVQVSEDWVEYGTLRILFKKGIELYLAS